MVCRLIFLAFCHEKTKPAVLSNFSCWSKCHIVLLKKAYISLFERHAASFCTMLDTTYTSSFSNPNSWKWVYYPRSLPHWFAPLSGEALQIFFLYNYNTINTINIWRGQTKTIKLVGRKKTANSSSWEHMTHISYYGCTTMNQPT